MPRKLRLFSITLLLPLFWFAGAQAADTPSGLVIGDVWARASVTATGAAYLTIENTGTADDVLVEVRSPVAEKVEIHDMSMDGMVMKMRKVDSLPVKAGEAVKLAPGGLHIMLIRLKAPLSEGMPVPLTLVFQTAGEVQVEAPVQKAGYGGD